MSKSAFTPISGRIAAALSLPQDNRCRISAPSSATASPLSVQRCHKFPEILGGPVGKERIMLCWVRQLLSGDYIPFACKCFLKMDARIRKLLFLGVGARKIVVVHGIIGVLCNCHLKKCTGLG